jgi:hypothetical protein
MNTYAQVSRARQVIIQHQSTVMTHPLHRTYVLPTGFLYLHISEIRLRMLCLNPSGKEVRKCPHSIMILAHLLWHKPKAFNLWIFSWKTICISNVPFNVLHHTNYCFLHIFAKDLMFWLSACKSQRRSLSNAKANHSKILSPSYAGLHIKCLLFLSNVKHAWICLHISVKIHIQNFKTICLRVLLAMSWGST